MTDDPSLPALLERLIEETSEWDIYRGSEDVQQFCGDVKSRLKALAGRAGVRK